MSRRHGFYLATSLVIAAVAVLVYRQLRSIEGVLNGRLEEISIGLFSRHPIASGSTFEQVAAARGALLIESLIVILAAAVFGFLAGQVFDGRTDGKRSDG